VNDEREAGAPAAGGSGGGEHALAEAGHERRDARVRPIALAFVGLFVATIVALVLMYRVLSGFTAREERASQPVSPLAASYGRQAPPEPRLQISPRDDLRRLHAREDALLHGYAWVDRQAGVARIPIDRAIELLAARGLPGGAQVVPTPGAADAGAAAPTPGAADAGATP
jgi:hypothetical protein